MVLSSCKQPFISIWFHDNSLSNDQKDKMKLYLNRTFYYYRIFVQKDEFMQYIAKKTLVAEIFLIISQSKLCDALIKMAQSRRKLFPKVYVFLPTEFPTVDCFATSSMERLFKEIFTDILQYNHQKNSSDIAADESCTEPSLGNIGLVDRVLPSISVFNTKNQQLTPIRHLTKESLNFACFLTMTDILRRTSSYTREELSEMWTACRKIYEDNNAQLDRIAKLETTYKMCEAIKHYTGNSCLSRTVNQACHTENMQQIFKFRVYISDLHQQLVDCHKKDESKGIKSLIEKLYRGKPLSRSVLQQLIDNEKGLISMNGFLSTTIARDVALRFAGDVKQIDEGQKNVLFLLEINGEVKEPYAYISSCSDMEDELEVLFSLGTIWRIKSVKLDEDPCIVELTSSDELKSQTTELLKKYAEKGCHLSSVGDILLELGNDEQAEWFYKKMLKQDSLDHATRGNLYFKIGKIRFEKKDYSIALENFKEAALLLSLLIDTCDKTSTPRPLYVVDNESPLIAIYNNMGLIHAEDDEFNKAVNCYNQALEIKNASNSEIATVHNNLGVIYYYRGDNQEAQKHHMKAIELIDESYPKWSEFKRNLDRINGRCQHLTNTQKNDLMQRTTIDNPIQ